MRITILIVLMCSCFLPDLVAQKTLTISSPDRSIGVTIQKDPDGQLQYSVKYRGQLVLLPSNLGLLREGENFEKNLSVISTSKKETIHDYYSLAAGKKKTIHYSACRKIIHTSNPEGKLLDIIFQVSNDGLAFRYYLPGRNNEMKKIIREVTEFHFDTSATAFLQPMSVAKSGWERTNPAYEEHYKKDIKAGTPAPSAAGWVYPALFHYKDVWMLITESSLDSSYCGSRLQAESTGGIYKLGFPDEREVIKDGGLLPRSIGAQYSPWRIITIGGLKTIIESTLGTDLARPAIKLDPGFIHPGKSSWSWIMSKDDSIVYSEQKRYIDFAADMKWQYCLIDADWDRKIGYEKIQDLSNYAAKKNVGLILWYNSSGDWNTVKYTPKNKLLTHEDRMKEFGRLKEMGIKGVKIDFFGGDGQSVIKYYIEILQDAASMGLMVNFHGATLPRGWSRTYPNLLTTEAVRGFEMVTFNQQDADEEATHAAMLPFTRNAFDPMDFTPMNLYRIPTRVVRKTTSAFELATSVLFLSGIQHYAESPQGMSKMPAYVKHFLQTLPDNWDDVRFIAGYPGDHVVIARRAGKKWYIAGINAAAAEKTVSLDLSLFNKRNGFLITDGNEPLSFINENFPAGNQKAKKISMKPKGGFVLVLDDNKFQN